MDYIDEQLYFSIHKPRNNITTEEGCYYKGKVVHIVHIVCLETGSTGYRTESVEEKQYGGFKTGPEDLFAQVSHTCLWHHTLLCLF